MFNLRRALTPLPDEARRQSDALAPAGQMGDVPRGFEAVAEAVAEERCPLGACEALGRELALDGSSADEALRGLRATWRAVAGEDPTFDALAALVAAWSDATLAVVNHISCEDPMTGLASPAHLRSSLAALFRGERAAGMHPRDSHALVMVELAGADHAPSGQDPIGRAMRMAALGESARTVFPGGEVVARLGAHRVAVLASRDARLGVRVRLLRRLLEGAQDPELTPRVWIEGLPASDLGAGVLLDELARG
ncbi:hypothetical protein IEQ44_02835 [Nocardioides sp. Y6]|uniref:GGDEF domain-containing protein n=1 Tax=Nocardioides malaquae TaxID=2773426 RepID=A0ABR9RPW5_9ACTN|nr:hypothetical protein [Nocardioides malaquae]MBE7323588.1 hypothetical protein [Nocardioides malaquae]